MSFDYDVIVIGSGLGGALAAHPLVHAGARVLMLERGSWVERGPHNWLPSGAMELTPFYSSETPYRVVQHGRTSMMGSYQCVGGQSVFYGAVALRFRERDFEPTPEIAGASGARWPFDYATLEPYYAQAECLLGVAGEAGVDPTEPSRSVPYPQPVAPIAEPSRAVEASARTLGLHPFRLPLAINYSNGGTRQACVGCTTCDCFACAIGAKNDAATAVLPSLVVRGLELRPETVVLRLELEGRRIGSVVCAERDSGALTTLRARHVVLAGGVLATPHLLLASGLERASPAGAAVGRYLMRHCNGLVYGFFLRPPNPARQFHKQIGIHDFYFGRPGIEPSGKLGSLQQVMAPPIALVKARVGRRIGRILEPGANYVTGLLAMAEDQPRTENGVTLDPSRRDKYGVPAGVVTHWYTKRDLLARRALVRQAKRVLRGAGARFFYVHRIETFSHAVGTVRMGPDPATAPLDEFGRFRGVDNLTIADASVMPTSAAVNPGLTIAALGLRAGEHIARAG